MSPDELRSAMRSLGYRTQNDLAQAIGVSRSAVSLWLEGKVGVPRPVAMLLRMLVARAAARLLSLRLGLPCALSFAPPRLLALGSGDNSVVVEIVTVEAGKLLRLELLERQRLRSAENAIDHALSPIARTQLRRGLLGFRDG